MTDLVPAKKNEIAGIEMFDIGKNMEGIKPKLPSIAIAHQAGVFKMPNGEKVESFIGIIIDQFPTNAYWAESFGDSGGGTPPDCFSMNAIRSDPSGEDVQNPTCKDCPMNQFKSKGRGKACKNMKRVHVLMDGSSYPHRITIPPTSLGMFDQYISTVTDAGKPYQLVYTEFSLKDVKNKDGIEYCELSMKEVGGIKDIETAQAIKAQISQWMESMRGEPIISDDYTG